MPTPIPPWTIGISDFPLMRREGKPTLCMEGSWWVNEAAGRRPVTPNSSRWADGHSFPVPVPCPAAGGASSVVQRMSAFIPSLSEGRGSLAGPVSRTIFTGQPTNDLSHGKA